MAEVVQYALFGHPVSHSRSPEIHRAFARQTGKSIRYELIDVEPAAFLPRVRAFFGSENGCGANVTVPHKLAAFEIADHVSSDAHRAGAVNTLARLEDGNLFGDNTDGAGLLRDLTVNHRVTIESKRVLLLGAGGAARGALGPLLDEGPAELVIANRHPGKAVALAEAFAASGTVRGMALTAVMEPFDVVINATSASLHDEIPEISASVIGPETAAYDMVYAAEPTAFLRWAKMQGAAKIIDGWGMMVEQAAEAFFIWRGVRPDTTELLKKPRSY